MAMSLVSFKTDGRYSYESRGSHKGDLDFDHFIRTTCRQFECPILINVVKKMAQRNRTSRLRSSDTSKLKNELKYNRKRLTLAAADVLPVFQFRPEPHNSLLVTTVYNSLCDLEEILMFNSRVLIPRVLMQVIALKVPFIRTLTKFTIKQCIIDVYTIYELNNILTISNITDICLDHSLVKEGNYDILLSAPSALRSLSLSRCNLNDIVCERIASRLHHLQPAEPNLLILNLSSNHITDVGLKHLGEALRTNRHLRYLNIADNHICDDGAKYIFDSLTEFPLNINEIQDKHSCYMQYMRDRESLYKKYMLSTARGKRSVVKSISRKGKHKTKVNKGSHCESNLCMKAQSMALEILGPFEHPFSSSMTTIKRGRNCCIGNFTLCYLNLRYNNLTYLSVQRLAAVVQYQKIYRSKKLCGLLNVLLEGNYIPENSDEIINLNNRFASELVIEEDDKIIPGKRNTPKRNV